MKCNICDFEFERPKIFYESRGAGCYEKIGLCPRCGYDDLDYDYTSNKDEDSEE